MTTKIYVNYSGLDSGEMIPDGFNALVPRGVSVMSYDGVGIIGSSSHLMQIFGDVFGSNFGISLGGYASSTKDGILINSSANVGSNNVAIQMYGYISKITNYGNVTSNGISIDEYNLTSDAKISIKNYGNISGSYACINMRADVSLNLNNFGTINSDGIAAISTNGGHGDIIYNRGSIVGDIILNNGADHIVNRGIIVGDINLAGGANYLDNRGGTIEGAITFGGGSDTFRPGAGIEAAFGGDGTDTLDFTGSGVVQIALDESILATGAAKDDTYGGFENITGSISGSDVLVGDGQANTLSGLNGADKLAGQAGADLLYGGLGSDRLDGGADDDELNGGAGNDTLLGGLGSDTLAGDDGNDLLTGGAGNDMLTGGLGSDRFIFLVKDFVGIDQNSPDEIIDFTQVDRDLIDLSAVDASTKGVGDQAFTFIGLNSFHSVAGELRYQQVAGNTYAFGDMNGDGIADFTLLLDGLITMTARDFIL